MNMFVSVAAAVAGLLFGLDIGVIAGALPFITDHFVLTSRLQEWVVSSMMLGAAIGALFNGWLSFRLGRKYSLMAGAILFVLGSIGSAFATSVEMLIAARVVLGIAVGIASYTAPLYLSEMASENVRGKMISMYQLMVTLGIVLAFYGYSAMKNPNVWGDQGRDEIKPENWNGYVVHNGQFMMYAGFFLAALAALDVIFDFAGWLYILILLGGLAMIFYPLAHWMHEKEGKWWPWPKHKKKK